MGSSLKLKQVFLLLTLVSIILVITLKTQFIEWLDENKVLKASLNYLKLEAQYNLNNIHISQQKQIWQNLTTPENKAQYNLNNIHISQQKQFWQNLTTPENEAQYNLNNIHISRHEQIWQNLTTPKNGTVFLYNAYYDDRSPHNGNRFIQVLAAGARSNAPVYAIMWTDNEISVTQSLCKAIRNGRGSLNWKEISYYNFFYSCKIEGDFIPKYISMTYKKESPLSNLLKVHIPVKERRHKFSICVATVYGHTDPYQIIEWITANQILGVTFFSVYPCNVTKSTMQILRQFEAEGIMRVSYTPSPYGGGSVNKQKIINPIAFEDCSFRQMYSTDYIIPLDFDEIITPNTNARNYEALLREINEFYGRKTPLPMYVFGMKYFLKNCGKPCKEDKMKLSCFVRKLSAGGYNPKSILDPRKCFIPFAHCCKINFKNFTEPKNKWISEDFAQVNHYRISKSKEQCMKFRNESVLDDRFKNKFEKVIFEKYIKTVERFKKLNLL